MYGTLYPIDSDRLLYLLYFICIRFTGLKLIVKLRMVSQMYENTYVNQSFFRLVYLNQEKILISNLKM